MIINESVQITKEKFEESFSEDGYYNKQTADREHLALLLNLVNAQSDDTILDLGTGSGYVAFALSEKCKKCNVIGLDIVTDTLSRNREITKKAGISNLEFLDYDGTVFPFPDSSMDCIVTRYALHHFPDIENSFKEMYRVLKSEGKLVIADPVPNENDNDRFVDKYMQIKQDGHIKFYSLSEYKKMLEPIGFSLLSSEMTTICFPRKKIDSCMKLLSETENHIIEDYKIRITDEEIRITEQVENMVFRKEG
ncbi:class I SAM-dependent methyltransferase [[Clostridium] hylemonae]|uniref:class I SAM-dependent methyltransferase n=1 Tax=[Clostridium] hylemonae TaxID=89153 RepID=UPI00148662F5|nr:methyltransferase domain-containing protein [[Clostridium] hylemonae]